jgi:hypothetical protein
MLHQMVDLAHGVTFPLLCNLFDGSRNNFDIHIDKKWKERQNDKGNM